MWYWRITLKIKFYFALRHIGYRTIAVIRVSVMFIVLLLWDSLQSIIWNKRYFQYSTSKLTVNLYVHSNALTLHNTFEKYIHSFCYESMQTLFLTLTCLFGKCMQVRSQAYRVPLVFRIILGPLGFPRWSYSEFKLDQIRYGRNEEMK